MRCCWNDLAGTLRDALRPIWERENAIRDELKPLFKAAEDNDQELERLRALEKERLAPLHQEKVEAAKPFRQLETIRAITRQYKGRMTSDLYEQQITSRWKTAMSEWPERRRRAREAGRPVRWETGMPGIQYELDSINLTNIFNTNTGSEIAFERLYEAEGVNGISLWRVPDEVTKRNAIFTVKAPGRKNKLRPVELNVKINRLPPMDSFVKRVSLVRRKDERRSDSWSLQFLLQLPKPRPRVKTGRVAGYDSIGWRLFEDRIRIGMIADNAGYCYEISVPIDMANRNRRREQQFVVDHGDVYEKGVNWFDLVEMDEEIGDAVQGCKDRLFALYQIEKDQWPEEARDIMRAFDRIRDEGLRRILKYLHGSGLKSERHLAQSLEEVSELRQWRNLWNAQAQRSKIDIYRKISVWVARNFDCIIWSPGSLKGMAEDPDMEYGLRLTQHRRQIVGQFHLRTYIEQAAAKYQAELKKYDEQYACPECGATFDRNGKLLSMCQNGHQIDIDVAASRWYLNQILGAVSISAGPLEIPRELRRYLRLLSASETRIKSHDLI
jgi:transposase